MYKLTRLVPLLFAFVLMLALGLSLAAAAPASKDSTTNKTTNTMKTKPSASAVKSTAKSSASKSRHVLASAEDLSGTITRVDPSDREVTLIGSNGVPYDFKVNQKTMVELSSHKIGMNELASESQKQATIHFVPRSDGNLAQSIRISAS
jgi:ABC-type oligopeptide transport system substrate-binding subunit